MKKNTSLNILIISYSFLLLIGGIIGHSKGSLSSMMMSSLFAILLLASLVFYKKSPEKGKFCLLSLTSLLTFFFLYRFFISFKIMPGGLLAIITAITTYACYKFTFCKGCKKKDLS